MLAAWLWWRIGGLVLAVVIALSLLYCCSRINWRSSNIGRSVLHWLFAEPSLGNRLSHRILSFMKYSNSHKLRLYTHKQAANLSSSSSLTQTPSTPSYPWFYRSCWAGISVPKTGSSCGQTTQYQLTK